MNKSITLQDFLKIMMIVFINIFLFIGEIIISFFASFLNPFSLSTAGHTGRLQYHWFCGTITIR